MTDTRTDSEERPPDRGPRHERRAPAGRAPADDAAAGSRAAKVPDEVDEASLESFPASDPPAWIHTRGD